MNSAALVTRYNSFTQRMVLRRPFVGDTGEDSALRVHCSGLPGDRAR